MMIDDCCLCVVLLPVFCYVIYLLLDGWYRAPKVEDLQKRYILVTGADSGFGNAISRRLDAIGIPVFAGCLTEHGVEDLREHCSNRLRAIRLDVSSAESIAAAVREVTDHLLPGTGLWAILNNAGISGDFGPIEWFSQDDYERAFKVNLYGIMNVNNAFLPLIKKTQGRIVNTASIAGRVAIYGIPGYVLSKFALEGYTDVLRRELRPFRVRVSIIEPGFVRTKFMETANVRQGLENSWSRLNKNLRQEYGDNYIQRYTVYMHAMISKFKSPTADSVVDAYEHALLARHPRMRYVVGKDANYVFWLFTLLPDWLGDQLHTLFGFDSPPPAVLQSRS